MFYFILCISVFSFNVHKKYKLILLSNRDEFFKRKTETVDIRDGNILSPRDSLKGGTWIGLNFGNKKIALLTNYRNPDLIDETAFSRGIIVSEYLNSEDDILNYVNRIESKKFNPFNLIFGSYDNLFYYNNVYDEFYKINAGVHVLSNGVLNEAWPKSMKLLNEFNNLMNYDFSNNDLLKIMQDEEKFPCEVLPDTNISKDKEYFLSSIFIKGEIYGTRTSTIVKIDYDDVVEYSEVTYDNSKRIIKSRCFYLGPLS